MRNRNFGAIQTWSVSCRTHLQGRFYRPPTEPGFLFCFFFFLICPMGMVALASHGDLNSMTVAFCKGVSMTNKNNGFI